MGNPELSAGVREFYREQFWNRLRADHIQDQRIAETLFDFAVNTGLRTAVRLAQQVLEATPDGILGPITIDLINQYPPKEFLYRYAMAKVARYAEIVNGDRSQSKFLRGWINRTLKGVA